MCLLSNLTSCESNNTAGQSLSFQIIPVSEVLTFPQTKEQASGLTEMGDKVELVGAFTLSAEPSKGFWRTVKAITDTTGVSFDLVGEIGSYGFENKFRFRVGGMDKERLGFAATVAQCCDGFIIKTKGRDGNAHIIGTPDNPAFIEPFTGEGGAAISDTRGVEYSFKAPSGLPPFVYDDVANPLKTTPNPTAFSAKLSEEKKNK